MHRYCAKSDSGSPCLQTTTQGVTGDTAIVVHQDDVSVCERFISEALPKIGNIGQFKVASIASPVHDAETVQQQCDQDTWRQLSVRWTEQVNSASGDLFKFVAAVANIIDINLKRLTPGTPVPPRVAAHRMSLCQSSPDHVGISPCQASDSKKRG